jgi:hypothetical protein
MYIRRYSTGNWDASPQQLSGYWGTEAGMSSQCRKPDIEIDSNDDPHVFWSQRHQESHQHLYLDIYYRCSTTGGDSWLYEDTVNQRHGYNVTHVDTSEWDVFLPQRPRFRIDPDDDIHLVYTCDYDDGIDEADSAFYVLYDGTWPTDPMDTEIASSYDEKIEADIAVRTISGSHYPYISYTIDNGSASGHGRAKVRLSYLNTSNTWVDTLIYQDSIGEFALGHFPCISVYGSEICVAVKCSVGLTLGTVNQHIKERVDSTGSGSWATLSVGDTSGEGYVSHVGHTSADIAMIYSDKINIGGLYKPDLYYDLN